MNLFYISAMPCDTMPSVSNGKITCPNNDAIYGSTCIIDCEDGYKLDGNYLMSCDEDGKWGSPGQCKGMYIVLEALFNQ